jgi:hypothetical protein
MTGIKLHSLPPPFRLICGLVNYSAFSFNNIIPNDRLPGEDKIGKKN